MCSECIMLSGRRSYNGRKFRGRPGTVPPLWLQHVRVWFQLGFLSPYGYLLLETAPNIPDVPYNHGDSSMKPCYQSTKFSGDWISVSILPSASEATYRLNRSVKYFICALQFSDSLLLGLSRSIVYTAYSNNLIINKGSDFTRSPHLTLP